MCFNLVGLYDVLLEFQPMFHLYMGWVISHNIGHVIICIYVLYSLWKNCDVCSFVLFLWSSKAIGMFEEDPRFLGVEKDREREELFEDYLVDLDRKVN